MNDAKRSTWGSAPLVVACVLGLALVRRQPSTVVRWGLRASAAGVGLAGIVVLTGEPEPMPLFALLLVTIACLGFGLARLLLPSLAVSILGLSVGVASLIGVSAVARGFEGELERRLARVHGHVLISKYGLDFTEYETVADRWLEHEAIRAASPFAYGSAVMVGDAVGSGTLTTVAMVKGVLPARAGDVDGFASVFASRGPAALQPANLDALPTIALGYRLARRHGLAVGDRVRLATLDVLLASAADAPPRTAEFTVVDILETGVLELDERLAFMHLHAAQALLFARRRVSGVELELFDPSIAPRVAAEVASVQNADHRLPLYRTTHWREQNAGSLGLIRQVRGALSLVLGLMVVVATSSLVASLLLLLRRRRRATAVLSTLGATPRQVFAIYESLGVFVGVVGGGLGLALGAGFSKLLANTPISIAREAYAIATLPVEFDWITCVVPVGVAVVTCALVTIPAALSASRIRPIEILR